MDKRLEELKHVVLEQTLEHTRRLLKQILLETGLPRPGIFPCVDDGDEPYATVQLEFIRPRATLYIDATGRMALHMHVADTILRTSDVLDIIPYLQEAVCSL